VTVTLKKRRSIVDVEGLYAPGLPRPEALPSGSSGYAHRTAREGLWGPTADRFAGAVLLAEMLGWGDETVREACYGETYFDPAEMPAQGGATPPRYRTLTAALARHYGQPVADLFERAWRSETLADCPTFGEWLVALPEHPVGRTFSPSPSATESTAGEETTSVQDNAVIESTAEIRAFMQAARRIEDKGNLEGALELYRQALELARADPSLRSLAREIELTVQDVEKRMAAQASPLQPAISPRPVEEGPGGRVISPLSPGVPFGDDKGPGVRAEPRRTRCWRWVMLGLAGLVSLLLVVGTLRLLGQPTPTLAGRIAFESDVGNGNLEIYVMNANGSRRTRLTNNSASDYNPSWSPDGQHIAFVSDRNGNYEIYVMNADGSGLTRLMDNLSRGWKPSFWSWSPDGRRIAFYSRHDGNDEIYVMNADGSGAICLTNNLADDRSPSWSPDGRRIAFASNRDGNWEIYIMNADGNGVTRLTNNSADDRLPSWSPDGRRIAFASNRDGNWEIYIMNADGNGVTRLTNNSADDQLPSWSPDGRRVAFVSSPDGNEDIYVINADGSGQIRLTNSPDDEWRFSWSPDGKYIAFQSNGEIYVMDTNGSRMFNLSNSSAFDGGPSWSPVP
jgi:Tol biopolymer transport system component